MPGTTTRFKLAIIIGTALAALVAMAAPAQADQTSIDWQRGLFYATGSAAADIGAPSPAIARLKAHRVALARAKKQLLRDAGNLPWATGGTLAAQLTTTAQKQRFAHVITRALVRNVRYASDGSVMLRVAVAIEAMRLAVVGPATIAAKALNKNPITTIVVDARKLGHKPHAGLTLISKDTTARYQGPTVYHRQIKTVQADSRLGTHVVTVNATRLTTDGGLQLDSSMSPATLHAARDSGALVVIVLGDRSK